MVIRKSEDMTIANLEKCHDGEGTVYCKSLLDGFDKSKFDFMHYNNISAGTSVGEHVHTHNDAIYFLLSGSGFLKYDGKEYEMSSGDISICYMGHSHGFTATSDSIMIVVGSAVD